jgi:hypothetical protein
MAANAYKLDSNWHSAGRLQRRCSLVGIAKLGCLSTQASASRRLLNAF